MRFKILQEINIAQIIFFTIIIIIVQQIKSSQMLVFDERGKPEDAQYWNWTLATYNLVEGKCSHSKGHPASYSIYIF